MGNAITQESRAVWIVLRRQGGWWTVKSLTHFFRPTFAEWELREILAGLVPGRYVMAREMVPGQPLSYAVTSECVPLPGVDLEAA